MNIHSNALLRGAFVGLSMIVPISIIVELLDRNVDDLDGSAWMVIPFLAVLAAYIVSGRIAGGLAPGTPLTHGALAALISFGGWLIVRVTIPLVLGNDIGFGGRAIVTNAMFATVFGVLGGALSMRDARV